MEIDLEAIWNDVLQAIQGEIPQASFEAWVQDTRAVHLEDDTMVVAARNAYARDWLESRLSEIVQNVLVENEYPCRRVRFVVVRNEETRDGNDDEGQSLIDAEMAYVTRYQSVVQPERVIAFPGYALRLLEQGELSPKQMSLWLGFRQAVYHKNQRGPVVRAISHREVCRYAMMSRASYFREIQGQSSLAGGLVEKLSTGTMGDACTYRVYMSPRLTRRDSAAIYQVLASRVAQASSLDEGVQQVLATLNEMMEGNVASYLDLDVDTISQPSSSRDVTAIVRDVLGVQELPPELLDAAECLFDHILGAYGWVIVPHYFLTTVVPSLGLSHAQAWAIILLRDRCWYDYETHTQSNLVQVPGGISQIARWVGVSRRSVELWMQSEKFNLFVQSVDDSTFLVRHSEPLDLSADGVRAECEKMRLVCEKMRRGMRKNETGGCEKMRRGMRKSETLLKPLLSFKTPIKPLQPPPAPSGDFATTEEQTVVVNPPSAWVLERLIQNHVVSPKILQRLRGGSGQALVSWLLYALSPAGVGIRHPWNYALDRLAQDPQHGAGGKYDLLASIPPRDLFNLALASSRGNVAWSNLPYQKLWQDVMGTSQRAGQALLALLFPGHQQIEMVAQRECWEDADGGLKHTVEVKRSIL